MAFGDANLLILPIRSFAGTVAYATCPYVLRQYQRDVGAELTTPPALDGVAHVTNSTVLNVAGNQIALEDLDINSQACGVAQGWAEFIAKQIYPDSVAGCENWREEFINRFVVLPDNIFSFLADTATEIRTRIRINRETRIVENGALWTEENLPAESVLWGVLGVSQARDKSGRTADDLAKLLPKDEINIQIGGKHTVGRGFCRLLIDNQGV